MNESLKKIEELQAKIQAELETLKRDFSKTIDNAYQQFRVIKQFDANYDAYDLLKTFGIAQVRQTGERQKKIGVKIAEVLLEGGMTLAEITKALPKETPERIKDACDKAKPKGTKKDRNPFYVDKSKYFSKK